MEFKFDHVGWITENIGLFEEFWCHGLGFELIHTSISDPQMFPALFDSPETAVVRLYKHPSLNINIEIHQVNQSKTFHSCRESNSFLQFGINHISLHTGGYGSRKEFIKSLTAKVRAPIEVKVFNNPKGWENIFIRDLEGNWIELREHLE